jgi:hypothetical protein
MFTPQVEAMQLLPILLFILTLTCSTARSFGQTATLTLYTPYRTGWEQLGEESGWAKSEPSWGRIFDGDQELVQLRTSRYATFQLPAGKHVLSARFSIQHHAGKKQVLTLDLKPEGRYYVRFTAKSKNYFGMELDLTEVDCGLAAKESIKSRPLELKYVTSEAQKHLSNENVLPQCSSLPHAQSSSH